MTATHRPGESARLRGIVAQFARFLMVGVVNTGVGIGTIFALKYFAGLGDVPANFLGYCVGLTVSFVLNRKFTFEFDGAWQPAAIRFGIVFAVAYSVNLVTVLALRDGAGLNHYLVHVIAVAPYTITFYLGGRWFAFRRPA